MTHILAELISEVAGDIYSSPRWDYPDYPGSARITLLADRVNNPDAIATFRSTPIGNYLLTVIDAYIDALNDDWLPGEIVGLPLAESREFAHAVWAELRTGQMDGAVLNLRTRYSSLSQKQSEHN